jgi:putative transposase
MNVQVPEFQYMQVCFDYIHNNPIKAGLVKKREDWEFSSYADIVGLRNGLLIDRLRIEKLGLIV